MSCKPASALWIRVRQVSSHRKCISCRFSSHAPLARPGRGPASHMACRGSSFWESHRPICKRCDVLWASPSEQASMGICRPFPPPLYTCSHICFSSDTPSCDYVAGCVVSDTIASIFKFQGHHSQRPTTGGGMPRQDIHCMLFIKALTGFKDTVGHAILLCARRRG